MVEHDGCIGCKYEYESEESIYCVGCVQNAVDKYEPQSNADRIRSMNDEELAELNVQYDSQYDEYSCSDGQTFYTEKEAINHEIDWLRQPAETEGTE